MNTIINNYLTALSNIGGGFCNYSAAVFVQSGLLIVSLLLIDFLLRKRVRAVFRYWMWMLVFVKLILPPTLSLPTGIGYWCGAYLSSDPSASQQASVSVTPQSPEMPALHAHSGQSYIDEPWESPSVGVPQVPTEPAEVSQYPSSQSAIEVKESGSSESPASNPVTWQGFVFLIWFVGVLIISVLLIQRMLFVKALVSESDTCDDRLAQTMNQCRRQVGVRRNIELRLSDNISSPAVCGLFRPVILVPPALMDKLSPDKLRAVFIHELAHIKRGDLSINLVQTVLQIIYFYNPLIWLVNALVRKIREQAVDEVVLVALGDGAKSYSNTLIDIAETAFVRASLSLRLIGVVESKKALHQRIKFILSRPVPKKARLGVVGLLAVIIIGAILLPMAGAKSKDLSDGNLLIKFTETLQEKPQKVSLDDITIWSKSREVEFAEAQEMLAAVELYQAGKPMQIIGRKIFEGSPEREKLTVTLVRKYRDIDRTLTNYSVKIQLGGEVSRLCEFSVQTNRYFSGTSYGWHQGHSMPALQAQQKDEHYIRNELIFQYCAKGEIKETRDQARFWIPGSNVTPVMSHHCIVLRLMPLAGLKHVSVEPVGGYQGLDGRIMPKTDFTLEQADKIATDYKNMLVRYISPRRFENDFKATLPNGVTVELIGVCEHPSKNKKWWRPDGKILSADQTPSEYSRMTVKPDENEQARELSMHFSGPGVESMSFRWKIDKSTRSSSHPFYLSKQREKLKPIRNIVFKVPRNTKTADLSVGVAVGDWKKAAYGGDGRTVSGTNDSLTGSSVIFHEAINENDMVKLSATHLLGDNYDCRIVVVDRDDKLHEPVKSSNSGDDMRLCTGFFSLQKEQIRQVMLESRPFHVAHFKNVSVKPGFRTDSKVRVTGESPENTVPQEMVGTWFFDNPGGDNEQMAVFPDSRVVVLYSNGHRDETRYLDGFIQLAEYDNARYKISVDKGGTLIQSFDSGGSLLISKRWERIDPQPRTSLLRQLTGPDKGQAVTRIEAGDAITYDWVIEHYGQTRRLSDKEKLEVDNWVSLHASVVKNSGRYLIPDNGLTLKDLIKAAGYNKSMLAESYVELIRRTRQGNLTARSVYSRNLKTLLNSRESDIVIRPRDAVVGGYILPSPNAEEFWGQYSFGDVIELNVSDDGAKVNMFADLDTGRLITPPQTLKNDDENAVLRWIKDNGIDVMGETAAGVNGLIGFNMYAARVDNYFWNASPREFTDRLLIRIDDPVSLSVEDFLPVTYLIKTSKYKLGILQILGFTENPRGIKIRYKLLNKEAEPKSNARFDNVSDVAGWQYIGRSIPPDFNDTMILAESVRLGCIGQDAEGKTFITFIRDGQEDRNNQYRFVLFTKDGDILEPDGHIVLDRDAKLQEKFTFDEPFITRRLKGFRFQTRPLPPTGMDSISSQLQKSIPEVVKSGKPIPSDLPPPGRYALELDGVDDYLLVPDSPTLRLEAPFTIEMWIKVKLAPDASEYRGGWAVISKGFYVGTPRAYLTGFGINLQRFPNEPSNLHIDFCKANNSGTYSATYAGYPLTNGVSEWIHIAHVFDGDHYKSTPGHPLVMGKFLIPTENPFKGLLGEIRLWNGALSRQDLQQYEHVALTGNEPGLAACWTFEQTEAQIAYDISPNRNHARLGKSTEPDDADPKWIDLKAP